MKQLPTFDLNGRTALVTGAGRGLGEGMAHGLAQAGAEVILVARTAQEIEKVCTDILAEGGQARAIVLDVTDDAAVQATFAELPSLDILVNNAGTNIPQDFVDVEVEALDRLLQLNVRAAFVVAQAAVRRMLSDKDRAERGGAVVNITSQLGRVRDVWSRRLHHDQACTRGADQGHGD